MNKKLVGLILALVVLMTTSLAFATVPSKIVSDMGRFAGATSPTGETLPLNVTIPTAAQAQAANDELAAMIGFLRQGAPLLQYFDQSVQDAIAALLPQGFNAASLGMNEFLPVSITGDAAGDAILSFEFATQYADGQPLVAMVGIKDDAGVTTWYPLQAEVVGGVVKIHFTQEVLEKMQTGTAMLAILSGEAG